MKHLNKNILFIGVALLVLIFIATKGFSNFDTMSFGNNKNVGSTAIEYVKEQISRYDPNAKVEIKSTTQKYGVTKVEFTVNDQEMELYISNDGKVLFPEAIVLDKSELLKDIPKTTMPEVKLFTMSYCPFGDQAEELIVQVNDELNNKVLIEPHYVIYSEYPSPDKFSEYCFDKDGSYCSLHGKVELNQNIREICIFKYNQNKFWNYINKVNNECTIENIETCWKEPALKLDIDTSIIERCFREEAKELLRKEKELNDEYSITASPTLLINGFEYKGDRTIEGFKEAICAGFKNPPKECK